MPTTFSSIVPVRRVAVGDCLGPQGRDGTDELTRTAFAALKAADWSEDSSAPSFPVHEYDRSMPSGDAWKACYGYSASARTQRAACGAVCYTFALPADAVASGNVANVTKIALSVTGDRYLDAGVDLHLLLSDSATPPTVAEWLAGPTGEIVSAALCATSDQAPTKPNQRSGETDAVEVEPTSAAARAYLHVALLLHDYLSTREGWIEGGAMLDGAAAAITFSRDVAEDGSETPAATVLFRVTGEKKANQDPDFLHTRARGFLYYADHSFWPNDYESVAAADATQFINLACSDSLVTQEASAWDDAMNDNILACSVTFQNDTTARYWHIYLESMPLYRPAGIDLLGRTIAFPGIYKELADASSVALGIIESDVIPTKEANAAVDTNYIPWRQIFTGSGDALVARRVFPSSFWSGTGATNKKTLSLAFSRNPTKRFLWVALVPLSGRQAYGTDSNPPVKFDLT